MHIFENKKLANTPNIEVEPKVLPQVNKSTFCEKNNVTATSHGKSIDLRLDIDVLYSILLQPGNVDLNVKVTNATENDQLGPR